MQHNCRRCECAVNALWMRQARSSSCSRWATPGSAALILSRSQTPRCQQQSWRGRADIFGYACPMGAILNLKRWPIADVCLSGPVGDVEMEQLLRGLAALADRGVPYVIVVDARNAVVPGLLQLKMMGDATGWNIERVAIYSRGTGIISNHPVVRHAITAVNWLNAPPSPQLVFANERDAERWAAETLDG